MVEQAHSLDMVDLLWERIGSSVEYTSVRYSSDAELVGLVQMLSAELAAGAGDRRWAFAVLTRGVLPRHTVHHSFPQRN